MQKIEYKLTSSAMKELEAAIAIVESYTAEFKQELQIKLTEWYIGMIPLLKYGQLKVPMSDTYSIDGINRQLDKALLDVRNVNECVELFYSVLEDDKPVFKSLVLKVE